MKIEGSFNVEGSFDMVIFNTILLIPGNLIVFIQSGMQDMSIIICAFKVSVDCNDHDHVKAIFKRIVIRMINTRWTPSGGWMLHTILCTF